ncbi:hypothetical protein F4779DRAFT_562846 [Xylariaceae sp. FL0662B]|nr:hypothetical protein F4779DRAFT_562846 [Xylariaceae sp. FL0662B]
MAKSSRASSRKTNNQRLKSKVFGPVETARAERLSARLLELAAQPKPEKPESSEANVVDGAIRESKMEDAPATEKGDGIPMDVDTVRPASSKRSGKKRIEKRRKKSTTVFPRYKDKKGKRKH